MKKLISVILSLAMLVAMTVSVCASPPDETQKEEQIEIAPRYSFTNNTKTLTTSKIVDGVELIIAHGSVTGYPGITTKIIIELELQKLDGDQWVTVNKWSETFNRHRGVLEKSLAVSPGTYRTFGTYTVFGGEAYEVIGSSSLAYEIK